MINHLTLIPMSLVVFISAHAQDSPPETPPEDPPPVTEETTEDPPSTLDDLLGIDPGNNDGGDGDTADERDQRRLDSGLEGAKAADAFVEAINDMDIVARRLLESSDTGIGTQRIQQSVIDRLDVLIQSAQRQQNQQSSQSQSPQDDQRSQSQQSPPSQGQQDSTQQGNGQQPGNPSEPPPGQEMDSIPMIIDESRVEWGNLPSRVRSIINQGLKDRISSLYQQMTEEYYRRLAEDSSS